MDKELCDCGMIAIWLYLPSSVNKENPFYCDECVSRGCSCNSYDNLENPTESWCRLDDMGREYPCCEFMFDSDGFEKE